MKIGFVVYQGMNLLEFALLYDPLTRIKTMGFDQGLSWDLVSYTLLGGDDRGLELTPTRMGGHLREYDILVIPGGDTARKLCNDEGFIFWLSSGAQVPVRCASGLGVLMAGMGGLLLGARAAAPQNLHAVLERVCKSPEDVPFLSDKHCLTCQGGLSALLLSLHLVQRLQGEKIRDLILQRIAGEYAEKGLLIPGGK